MIAEVIAIGSELIHGLVPNTNLDLISGLLAETGIRPSYHTTVGDVPEHLGDALRTAVRRSDLVIMTGGLGPTADDITAFCAALPKVVEGLRALRGPS